MRAVIVFILLFCASYFSRAHDFYFGFAEVEYNSSTNKFEGTIIFTTHDLEKSLEKDHPELPPFDLIGFDSKEFGIIESVIKKGFAITVKGVKIKLDLIGLENFLTGTTNIYFESEEVNLEDSIIFEFVAEVTTLSIVLELYNLIFVDSTSRVLLPSL